MDPYISVIVTAHDRRKYLPDALRSLEAQTLGRDRFEVIVVKNFEDPASDKIIRRNGWKDIVTDVVPLGGKVAIGLEEAKGDIITFLEDDDMYLPDRLQVVEEAFRGHRDVVYFHNRQLAIDESGRPLRSAGDLGLQGLPSGIEVLIGSGIKSLPCAIDIISEMLGANFNNSSIAIRRDLIDQATFKDLMQMFTGVDNYLYVKAFVGDKLLYVTGRTLTLYRVHPHRLSAANGLSEPQRLLALLRRLWEHRAYSIISRVADVNCQLNSYRAALNFSRLSASLYAKRPLELGHVHLDEALAAATFQISYNLKVVRVAGKAAGTLGLHNYGKIKVRALELVVRPLVSALGDYLLQFLPWEIKRQLVMGLTIKMQG